MPPQPHKLLDQVRHTLRRMHYSMRTEEAYVNSTAKPIPKKWMFPK